MKLTATIEGHHLTVVYDDEARSIEDFIANVKKIIEGLKPEYDNDK